MALQTYVNDITHNVEDAVSSAYNYAKNAFAQINGSVTTGLKTLWSGGFVGMSEQGVADIETALENYIAEIQGIIDGFDPEGDISVALAGAPKTAAYDFIQAVKLLLQAYVSTMRAEKAEMREAYDNFIKAGQNVSTQVTQDAEQIRQDAQTIKMD